tara:strand:- start:1147 stop:1914 length:768 start_codon:yes stop_codon:yes gene_type:complete
MSLLSEDRATEMLAKLRGEPEQAVTEPEVVEETVSPQVEPDVEQEASSAQPEPEEAGHNVPYQRFQQVISAKNRLQEEKERLANQLQELQTQFETNNSRVVDKVETVSDTFTDDFGSEGNEGEVDPRYQQLETRVQQFEVYKEEQLLERELQQVAQEFPQVPRELLLQAVIDDPNSDLLEVAGHYTTYVAQVEEQAIARYVKDNDIQVPKRGAAAGGSSGGGKATSQLNAGHKEKPKTIKEATSRFKSFLKNNPF